MRSTWPVNGILYRGYSIEEIHILSIGKLLRLFRHLIYLEVEFGGKW